LISELKIENSPTQYHFHRFSTAPISLGVKFLFAIFILRFLMPVLSPVPIPISNLIFPDDLISHLTLILQIYNLWKSMSIIKYILLRKISRPHPCPPSFFYSYGIFRLIYLISLRLHNRYSVSSFPHSRRLSVTKEFNDAR
jgi:hypothetical protein